MKKIPNLKLVSAFLALLIITLSLTGCGAFKGIKSLWGRDVAFDYPSTLNEKLVYDLDDGKIESINKMFSDLHKTIEDGKVSADDIVKLINEIENSIDYLESQSAIAYLNYCVNGNDTTAFEKYGKANATYSESLTKIYSAYKNIYDSKYSEKFFADWSEKEISAMLDYAKFHTSEYDALVKQYNDVVEESRALDTESEDFYEQAEQVYKKAVKLNNKKAECFGLDNYMEFAYKYEYSRDYIPKDTEKLASYAKEYLFPLYKDVTAQFDDISESASSATMNNAYELFMGDFRTDNMQSLIENYTRSTNKTMYGCFMDNKLDAKYYVTSDSDGKNSYSAAFTVSVPSIYSAVMYFGEGYHDPMSFVHEFGHFTAEQTGSRINPSLDICEMQSQGNELMFLAYIEGKMQYVNAYGIAVCLKLEQTLRSIIQCLIVNDFEMSVYSLTESELDAADIDSIYRKSCEKIADYDELCELFGYDLAAYWRYVTVEAPGYYISYAVSLLPCVELYGIATEDYAKAADIYSRILSCVTPYFESELSYAGLDSPFDEEIFKAVADSIGNIINAEPNKAAA